MNRPDAKPIHELKAREIMSTNVHHVTPQLRLVDLECELSSHRISGAPVVERGNVIGIVSRSDIEAALSRERIKSAAVATFYHESDLSAVEGSPAPLDPTGAALESLRTVTVRDIMTPEVISVSGEHPVVDVAELMRTRRIHRVLVVEEGRLLGIVSSLDIVSAVANRA